MKRAKEKPKNVCDSQWTEWLRFICYHWKQTKDAHSNALNEQINKYIGIQFIVHQMKCAIEKSEYYLIVIEIISFHSFHRKMQVK